MQNTVCIFNHSFKEFFWLLQGEKAFQFPKPQGGKIQSGTKSDFVTVCVIMNNIYQRDTRKEKKAMLMVEASSGGI